MKSLREIQLVKQRWLAGGAARTSTTTYKKEGNPREDAPRYEIKPTISPELERQVRGERWK
jgi:hypothetical protein